MPDNVVFPHDFVPAHITLDPALRVVLTEDAARFAAEGDAIVEIPGHAAQGLALRGFKVFDVPRSAKSQGSQATYLARGADKRQGLLLQYLPPHATTSLHYHAVTRETFHLLAGRAALRTPWGVETSLAPGQSWTNGPFVPHQVVTYDSFSVILLEMVAPDPMSGMEDHFYVDPLDVVDVDSRKPFPAGELSNFAAHAFELHDVACASMEGFLQSLKESDPEKQRDVCALVGWPAKKRGLALNEGRTIRDPLHWRGSSVNRLSAMYQELLDLAYGELAKNAGFQDALRATGKKLLTHAVGHKRPEDTILTETELCSRLLRIRHNLS